MNELETPPSAQGDKQKGFLVAKFLNTCYQKVLTWQRSTPINVINVTVKTKAVQN